MGLTNASHHNGKIGRVSARAGPNGRIGNVYCNTELCGEDDGFLNLLFSGVDLGEGQTLAVRRENLEHDPTLSLAQKALVEGNVFGVY